MSNRPLVRMLNLARDASLTFQGIHFYHSFLKYSQYWDEKKSDRYKITNLKNILISAEMNSSYYRELFWNYNFDPNRFESLSQLEALPVLTKQTLKDRVNDFYSYRAMQNAIELHTSGSTGEPLKVFTSPNQWRVEQGIVWRHWKWAGYKFRDKMAIVRSYSPGPNMPLYRLDSLRNWMYLSANHLSEEQCETYLRLLQRWQPKFLRGYPTSLYLLARVASEKKIQIPSIKAALTASETLENIHREAIYNAFGVEVYDHYGQAEITAMFHECESHAGMHIDSEYGHVELIKTDIPNEFRIVATNLHNTAMPLVRYDTGDIAIADENTQCSCGRALPLIRRIQGRRDQFIYHTTGYPIPTVNFYTFFSKLDNVYKFQIIQNSLDDVSVNLLLKNGKEDVKSIKYIERELAHRIGCNCKINITNQFKESSAGKCLPIIQSMQNRS